MPAAPALSFDAVVVGAGAAGLFCAGIAGQRGLRVLVIDHSAKVAEKIRISGGGRCNFTNRDTTPLQFLSTNPHFCRSALARFSPADFIELMQRHGIGFHEKHKGQLFCDDSSEQVIGMLLAECDAGHVERWHGCAVQSVQQVDGAYALGTDQGTVSTRQLIVATGGLSIPKIGASDWGHRLARQFGHKIVEPRPALVPLTFDAQTWAPWVPLAGASLEAIIQTGVGRQKASFREDLLFTHRGLSGPGILQISSHWQPGQALNINLLPDLDVMAWLQEAKLHSKRQLGNALSSVLPHRLAEVWLAQLDMDATKPLPELRDRDLQRLAQSLTQWQLTPDGTEGWRKAEVTRGGVDTRELESQSMESKRQRGLFFIGEVMDVTGWLGGYNFQWAWASAAACARALTVGSSR
jgi:hypothetical protein